MRSSVKIGDECPNGSSVFQITFSPGPNVSGSAPVSEIPEPFGPRKRDQASGPAARVFATPAATPTITATHTKLPTQRVVLFMTTPESAASCCPLSMSASRFALRTLNPESRVPLTPRHELEHPHLRRGLTAQLSRDPPVPQHQDARRQVEDFGQLARDEQDGVAGRCEL